MLSEQRYRSRRIVECDQLLQFVLGCAGQSDFLAGLIDDKAVIRYAHKMPAEAEEAADLQHRETELLLVLVRDHVIDGPDLFVLVVDHGGAAPLSYPIYI